MALQPFAVFRCDGGPLIGTGHVMRCLAFADRLEDIGWQTQFAVSPETVGAVPSLASRQTETIRLDENDSPKDIGARLDRSCDLAVIDHYERDAKYETACRDWAKRVFIFDDLADRKHDCDMIADFTPGRTSDAYEGKIPEHCRKLIGANHAPLRRSFFRTRIVAPDGGASDQPRHILISPGATDPTDISSHALDAIRHAGLDVSVTIALGSAAPHKEKVDAKLSDHDAELLIDCNDMAGEISRADLVIGAGGMSAWERCCLGKPTLMAVTAANQKANAAALSEMGAIQVVEAPEDSHLFGQTISGLLSDANALRNMKNRAIELCDGLGSARLAIAATPAPKAKDGKPVSLRPVTREDSDIMFAWQQEPEMRRYARNRQTPKRDEHESWLANKLADPRCIFNIITHGDTPAGVLRFDYRQENEGFEISILVGSEQHNLGIAGHALALGRVLIDDWDLLAYVDSENRSSLRLFEHAGYSPTSSEGWWCAPAKEIRDLSLTTH